MISQKSTIYVSIYYSFVYLIFDTKYEVIKCDIISVVIEFAHLQPIQFGGAVPVFDYQYAV